MIFRLEITAFVTTMVNKQNIIRMLVLLMLSTLMASCSVIQQVIEKPTVHVQEVKYQPVNLKQGRLDSRVRITNPNGFKLPLRSIICHLELNGHKIADTRLNFDKDLPAKGSMEIGVPVSFQYGELVNGISSLLVQHDIKFQLVGEIDLRLVKVPFSKSGEFRLKLR